MKYIRTKDEFGIEREDGTCCFKTWAAKSNSPLKKDWLYADTIEELCDEFVQEYTQANGIGHLQTRDFNEAKNWNICDFKVYGAIWTDKGLIYVAKMNDKGELELI